MIINLGVSFRVGVIDTLHIESYGILRLSGWSDHFEKTIHSLQVTWNDQDLKPFQIFSIVRNDVVNAVPNMNPLCGFQIEYKIEGPAQSLKIRQDSKTIVNLKHKDFRHFQFLPAAYAHLLDSKTVYHRENIYGSGLPVSILPPGIPELTDSFTGATLDFGCGIGALVGALREKNKEAYGIEIDRPEIRDRIPTHLREYIRLYDGKYPLPYKDGQFENSTAVEVIEHIPDYELALSEIARITSKKAIFTVPDMSSIPICHSHAVVPWHLLEATHFNFFNPTSFRTTLEKYFQEVSLVRTGDFQVNGRFVPGSIVGICTK